MKSRCSKAVPLENGRGNKPPSVEETLQRSDPETPRGAKFVWRIKPYSKLQNGIHHFKSPPFSIDDDHCLRLLGSIDSISTIELKAAVKFLPPCNDKAEERPWFRKVFSLRLLSTNTADAKPIEVIFPAQNLFKKKGEQTTPWVLIAMIKKAKFPKGFVWNDTIVVEFTLSP